MNIIHHRIEERSNERMKRCKIWSVILLCVCAFVVVLLVFQSPADSASHRFSGTQTSATKTNQPRKIPTGEGLPSNLLQVFKNFSSIIGTPRKDTYDQTYRINNFYLRDVPLYTFVYQPGTLLPQ